MIFKGLASSIKYFSYALIGDETLNHLIIQVFLYLNLKYKNT